MIGSVIGSGSPWGTTGPRSASTAEPGKSPQKTTPLIGIAPADDTDVATAGRKVADAIADSLYEGWDRVRRETEEKILNDRVATAQAKLMALIPFAKMAMKAGNAGLARPIAEAIQQIGEEMQGVVRDIAHAVDRRAGAPEHAGHLSLSAEDVKTFIESVNRAVLAEAQAEVGAALPPELLAQAQAESAAMPLPADGAAPDAETLDQGLHWAMEVMTEETRVSITLTGHFEDPMVEGLGATAKIARGVLALAGKMITYLSQIPDPDEERKGKLMEKLKDAADALLPAWDELNRVMARIDPAPEFVTDSFEIDAVTTATHTRLDVFV